MKRKNNKKSPDIPEMNVGGFFKDLGKWFVNTNAQKVSMFTGDVPRLEYETGTFKTIGKPLEQGVKQFGKMADAVGTQALNTVMPGSGDALGGLNKSMAGPEVVDAPQIKGEEVTLNKNPYGMPTFKLGGMLKKYNAPTHENGGQMIDANGNPINTSSNAVAEIEKKETSFKDFVFSDNLEAKENKTYAQESKRIARKYANKVDKLSKNTMEFQMKNLMNANQQHKELVEAEDNNILKFPNGGVFSTINSLGNKVIDYQKNIASHDDSYQKFKNTLPPNLKNASEKEYAMRYYWENSDKPESFAKAISGQNPMFTKESDGSYHAPSVEPNTLRFLKHKTHPTVQKELDWYNSNDPEAVKFKKNYDIDMTGDYYKYKPKEQMKNGGVMKYGNGGPFDALGKSVFEYGDIPVQDYNDLGTLDIPTDIVDTKDVTVEPTIQTKEKFKLSPEMIGTALKGAGIVKSGFDALQPVEKEKLQLNPNANRVENLMSNRNVNFAALQNENLYNRNAALENAQNTRSANVNRALDSNIYTQAARNAMRSKLDEQQANNQLRGEEAQTLNNLGMQESNERIRQQNIQSMNDATKRGFERSFFEDLGKVGDSVIDKGIYDQTMKNMQANYANEFQQNVQLLRDKAVNFTFMEDADKIMKKLANQETLTAKEWETVMRLNTEAKKLNQTKPE